MLVLFITCWELWRGGYRFELSWYLSREILWCWPYLGGTRNTVWNWLGTTQHEGRKMSGRSEAAVPREFSGMRRFLRTFTLPQQVAFPHPLTQKDGPSEPPSLDSDESLHSSVHTALKSQCTLWQDVAAPLSTHCVSQDSASTTAAPAGKGINTRHARYCKIT